jgi:uncharacterized spore protein YtfJ
MRRKFIGIVLGSALALGGLTACGEAATDDGTGTGTGTGASVAPMASDGMMMESPDAMMASPDAMMASPDAMMESPAASQ